MATLLVSGVLAQLGRADEPLVTAIIILVILVAGFRLVFRILPPWVGSFLGDVFSFFLRLVLGTGIKGKK